MCYNLNNVNMFPLSPVYILFLTYFSHKNILMHFLAASKGALSHACEELNDLVELFYR